MDVYGLLGNPVGHSSSPSMHEAAFEELGLDARYVTFEPDDVGAAIEGAEALGIRGLNVTIPFKRDVLAFVDPDPTAERIGAVNTVDLSTSPPTGHNTDAGGAVRALEHHDVSLEDRTVVLVGAGGAARAIAFAVTDEGANLTVANRTVETAESLAAAVGATAHGLDALGDLLVDADVLVNATSVGMDTDDSPVPADALHADLAVMDIVYSPLETRLLRDADACGAETIDGAWMLLFQGVEAFEHWTEKPAPVDTMNHALRANLE